MKIKVLDDGFIELVDKMGNDYSIIRAARVSTGTEIKKGDKKDRGLIRYLYKNNHLTPFEQIVFTFHIRSPLFVNQQILRHRTFSFNQESARYKKFEWKCYIPEEWRKQGEVNKQGSSDGFNEETNNRFTKTNNDFLEEAKKRYENNLECGIVREQARIVMPMGQYTELFFTANLRNILHFIDLRSDSHAQQEMQEYAIALFEILNNLPEIKWTMEIYCDMLRLRKAISKSIEEDDIDGTIRKLSG